MTNAKSNLPEFSVSELSQVLKRTIEDTFSHVRVRAELSRVVRHSSGHLYMTLKDENAVLDGVMWRGVANTLTFRPEDGLEVVCTGKLSIYAGRSKYQLIIERMEPAGEGALMALLEARKKKLAAEGLFDTDRKKKLPFLPEVIGVITSPTGAVIRDILHRLQDRFPRRVLVWPVAVQGETASGQIAAAIQGFNRFGNDASLPRPDVLIVARGGGSLEDLWAFNEEEVVRAAADSMIPLISAVGHETDTTLIDYAADLRAPTPTAAAEMAVPVRAELEMAMQSHTMRLSRAGLKYIEYANERLKSLSRALPTPRDILGMVQQRLDDLSDRLPRGLKAVSKEGYARLSDVGGRLSGLNPKRMIVYKREQLAGFEGRLPILVRNLHGKVERNLSSMVRVLESLGYHNVLKRGYAVVYDGSGKPLTRARSIMKDTKLDIEMQDGRFAAIAISKGVSPQNKKKKQADLPKKPDEKQGTLL